VAKNIQEEGHTFMRFRTSVICIFLLISVANFGRSNREPDYGKVSGGTFTSEFFKFHYTLPTGWVATDDQARMQENRTKHKEAVKKEEAKLPKNTPNTTTTTTVFWNYDLLVATPAALKDGTKPAEPYIRIGAAERNVLLDKAGDHANMVIKYGIGKVVKQPNEQMIGGRKFVRADLVYKDSNYEALFDTVSDKYILSFEFRGKSEEEINELAKTMESLKFD
jgi:hypothetical protein